MKNILFRKIAITLILLMALQIPITKISSLISERSSAKRAAEATVKDIFGYDKSIATPYLETRWPKNVSAQDSGQDNGGKILRDLKNASFEKKMRAPLHFSLTIAAIVEERKRGLFTIPVYTTTNTLELAFAPEHFAEQTIGLEQNLLIPEILNNRGNPDLVITINGSPLSLEKATANQGTLSIPLPKEFLNTSGKISIQYHLTGTDSLTVLPDGTEGTISVSSNWPNTSLGGTLPARKVESSESTFNAEWHITNVLPEHMRNKENFSLAFMQPIDDYRMSERTIEYSFLLLVIIFATVLIFESLYSLKLHPMNYLLVGAALVLFYLLTFSLAEHLGFRAGYTISALIIIVMTSLYIKALANKVVSVLFAGIVSFLYAFFFSLLQEQNYALLFGSLGVTALLGATMMLTRSVNWAALGQKKLPPVAE